ncbi:uncharacterized protein HMPREF1541_03137 [Cyphellophora europaea CBS 101466]|uniref:EthD domain-containing protein n=1 Tax=Cyphellophora europaea (strain CBS 101466) TaxID=1220924 RepID=W2RXM6_CYPE1|nr:uncharacterized protein HMPREF1541_03137 [Cyphellophora europaea CBS 101466]ETN41202.1 hypothetical protein HMPREF1541_03137 [Cyphellophora europaea CBS 101466]
MVSESPSTPASSVTPTPGVLWVTCNIMKREPHLSEELFDSWYEEHLTDVLNTPGNGGLALRYINADASVDLWSDPDFASRYAAPAAALERIRDFSWKALALVKLSDVAWCASQPFNDMPRTSKQVPQEPDGSDGSVFNCWHAGLRTYETVDRKDGVKAGSKWLVSVQTESADKGSFDKVLEAYTAKTGCQGYVAYRLVEGLLPYPEPPSPGNLPQGMVIIEFDGEKPSAEVIVGAKVVRIDVWDRKLARGDLELGL